MTTVSRNTNAQQTRAAAYLRCFPYDAFQTGPHRGAVLEHARALALPTPDIYFDNGRLSTQPLPQLTRLLTAIAAGFYHVVLLPGPFVLSLDDDKARATMQQMRDQGCQVMELPCRHALTDGLPGRAHPVQGGLATSMSAMSSEM